MTRRERLMAVLRGEQVDRPPVCFYELDGLSQNPNDDNPLNIFSHPSWKPLLDLTWEKSDCIHMYGVGFKDTPPNPLAELTTIETWTDENGSLHSKTTVRAGNRILTEQTRRNPDVWTVWTTEPLLKDIDDFKAWLDLPEREPAAEPDVEPFLAVEDRMGERGIVMVDTGDPICGVAPLFDLGVFTVVALTEPGLLHRALEREARVMQPQLDAIADALPGRHWRIYGPEYASPPYLPPELFEEYVVRYDKPICETVKKYGGYPRLHSHGRLKPIIHHILETGCIGTDPVEPPPQGDVSLAYVRHHVPDDFVLFGNIEASDIENLATEEFAEKVKTALREGPNRDGTAFVLMPSSCPFGRRLSAQALRNYEKMVELAGAGL